MASSATVSAPKKRKSFSEYFHSMRGQQLIVTLVFLFVPLVLLFMFTYLPFFKMVEFSFFKMKYIGRRTFVGLQNYISVFTRKDCFHALSLSLYYMVGSVVQMALQVQGQQVLPWCTVLPLPHLRHLGGLHLQVLLHPRLCAGYPAELGGLQRG